MTRRTVILVSTHLFSSVCSSFLRNMSGRQLQPILNPDWDEHEWICNQCNDQSRLLFAICVARNAPRQDTRVPEFALEQRKVSAYRFLKKKATSNIHRFHTEADDLQTHRLHDDTMTSGMAPWGLTSPGVPRKAMSIAGGTVQFLNVSLMFDCWIILISCDERLP